MTNRGGRRIRAGDKPEALADKISKGKPATIMELPVAELSAGSIGDPADLTGSDMPDPSSYLSAKQRDGKPLGADEIYRETWMDARKAVELGFADGILKRDTADLNDEPAMTDTLYSPARVTNSLMDKIAAKCRIEGKQATEDKVKADTLIARLDLLKNWR